tara:strand:+ start:253 stop:483 length:231 start_codon:yes stop_codon:yes gene_type:complete
MNRKQRRAARKKMSNSEREKSDFVSSAIEKTPKACTRCSAIFDSSDQNSLDTWKIEVYSTEDINLICPNCDTGGDK